MTTERHDHHPGGDPELLERKAGLIDATTPVVTTVHELQLVDEGQIPVVDHDVPLDLIVTPERVIEVPPDAAPGSEPGGVLWEELTEEKIRSIPLLQRLRPGDPDPPG